MPDSESMKKTSKLEGSVLLILLNKNGVLDKNEFIKIMVDILKKLGEDLPEKKHLEVAEEGFTKFDLNENSVIEFNEFYEFMRFVISEKGYDL